MERNEVDRLMNATLFGVGVGVVLGAVLGVLLTPQPGSETRKQLTERFRLWRDRRTARMAHEREQEEARKTSNGR